MRTDMREGYAGELAESGYGFLAIVNTPGYMPWSDEPPPAFSTAQEAWAYLADERQQQEDNCEDDDYSDTYEVLANLARGVYDGPTTPEAGGDGQGVVYGDTPGYDGEHDLGIVYSVQLTED